MSYNIIHPVEIHLVLMADECVYDSVFTYGTPLHISYNNIILKIAY